MFAPTKTCTHSLTRVGTHAKKRHDVLMYVLALIIIILINNNAFIDDVKAPLKACAQTVVFCRTIHVQAFVGLHVDDVVGVSASVPDVPLRLGLLGIVPQLCKCGKGKRVCAKLFWCVST